MLKEKYIFIIKADVWSEYNLEIMHLLNKLQAKIRAFMLAMDQISTIWK